MFVYQVTTAYNIMSHNILYKILITVFYCYWYLILCPRVIFFCIVDVTYIILLALRKKNINVFNILLLCYIKQFIGTIRRLIDY